VEAIALFASTLQLIEECAEFAMHLSGQVFCTPADQVRQLFFLQSIQPTAIP
jgi:hypothetical protein